MRRLLLLIVPVLGLAAAGSPLLAEKVAPHRPAPAAARTQQASDLARSLWSRLAALWSASGCGLDPNGVHCASSAPAQPHGLAVAPSPSGCGIDPDGLCSQVH